MLIFHFPEREHQKAVSRHKYCRFVYDFLGVDKVTIVRLDSANVCQEQVGGEYVHEDLGKSEAGHQGENYNEHVASHQK